MENVTIIIRNTRTDEIVRRYTVKVEDDTSRDWVDICDDAAEIEDEKTKPGFYATWEE